MKFSGNNIIIGSCLLTAVILDSGCKKELNINENPNVPTLAQGTPSLVFPVGVLATIGETGNNLEIACGFWSQYFTQAALSQQYVDLDSYNMPPSDGTVNGVWDVLFTSGLKNYQYVVQSAAAEGDWNYYLLGTVMGAYTTELLTDLYDQIPYAQALQGASNLTPHFEGGDSVYQALITNIDTALGKDFTAGTLTQPGSQDLIFGGDMTQWMAFANTLKLKMYLRMVNANPTEAQAGVEALYTAGATFLTQDAAVTNFSDAQGMDNPLYESNIRQDNTGTNLRASTTFVSWLETNNDPRIGFFFGPGPYNSINQGDFRNISPAYTIAQVYVQTPTDPVELLSAAESYFLQAEAAVRYFGGLNAQTLYNQGVMAAFAATGNDATAFIAPGGVYAWGTETEGGRTLGSIEQIIRQKWASCAFGCHAAEAFFDQIRTGYPARSSVYSTDPSYIPGELVVSKNSVLAPGLYPKRMVFPYDESSRNPNTPATVPLSTAPWWGQ